MTDRNPVGANAPTGSPAEGTGPLDEGTRPASAPPVGPEAAGYSKDYWDGVFEQIGRRPLVKACLAVLALLYALAIFAPFLANDRPFLLEAFNQREYTQAQRTLPNVLTGYTRLVMEGEERFLANLRPESRIRSFDEALGLERNALEGRIQTLRNFLAEEDRAPLEEVVELLTDFERAARAGESESLSELQSTLRDRSRGLRTALQPLDPEQPEAGGVALLPRRSWPIFESTTATEVFFMVLWLFVLSWPVWNRLVNRRLLHGDRARIRRARRIKLGVVLGSSFAAALAWSVLVGGSMTFETSPYKEGLTRGDIVATRVVMAPIAMGFAESHLNERFRPPTWLPMAELSEEGYYVRGRRAPQPDPVTGALPPPNPPEIRFGEPPANAPHRYLFGADGLGRDLVARMLYGGRISLMVGLVSAALLVSLGVFFGAIAGYMGGWVDLVISRVIEVIQALPTFFFILVVVAVIPETLMHPITAIVITIGLIGWTGVARLVRGEFLKLKGQDYVIAARALGFRSGRIVFRHVLPNALGPVLVAGSFAVASGILLESAVSFLGLGIKLPIPSWGSVLNEARQVDFWWTQVIPGLFIFVTVFCYNMVGEGLRDALDPRMKV